MAAKKKEAPKIQQPTFDLWEYAIGRGRIVTVSLLFAIVIAGSAIWAWQTYSHHLRSDPDYVVTAEQISLVPAVPEGLPADIKLQALRMGSLDGPLPLLDPELAPRLAQAFALHPWIERVERVEKTYPARVTVRVKYRQLAVMVQVRNQAYAVDRWGVVLPGDDVQSLETAQVPRLEGVVSPPAAPAGFPWGDELVRSAARLADLLNQEAWQRYRFASIRNLPPSVSRLESPKEEFEVLTHDGLRVVWGHAPGEESTGEPQAEQKLRDMAGYFAKQPQVDPADPIRLLDLRRPMMAAPAESFPEVVGLGERPQ